jgi:hypothetical protein
MFVSYLAYSSTPQVETTFCSETSVYFRITWRYIANAIILYSHYSHRFKDFKFPVIFELK